MYHVFISMFIQTAFACLRTFSAMESSDLPARKWNSCEAPLSSDFLHKQPVLRKVLLLFPKLFVVLHNIDQCSLFIGSIFLQVWWHVLGALAWGESSDSPHTHPSFPQSPLLLPLPYFVTLRFTSYQLQRKVGLERAEMFPLKGYSNGTNISDFSSLPLWRKNNEVTTAHV